MSEKIGGFFPNETVNAALHSAETWKLSLPVNQLSDKFNGAVAKCLLRDAIQALESGAPQDHPVYERWVPTDDSSPELGYFFRKKRCKLGDIVPNGRIAEIIQVMSELELLIAKNTEDDGVNHLLDKFAREDITHER